jgi:Flp pilus assembly protein TadG
MTAWFRRMMLRMLVGRLKRDERGAVAVEFALLALPFFTLIFAIIETSMVFFASQILDSAVQDAGRLVRTGQAHAANYNSANFRTAVCNGTFGLFRCANLKVKVSVVANFTAATTTGVVATGNNCTQANCPWTLVESYSPGTGGDVVLVEVYYRWPMIVNLPGLNLFNLPDGTRLLSSIRVFRNEPFSCTSCT